MSDPFQENKAVVTIFGEEYPITGAPDPSHISRVADCVDKRINEVAAETKTKRRDRIAILAAMSLASELLELQERLKGVGDDATGHADEILRRLEKVVAE